MQPGSSPATAQNSTSFEQQLSQALSESLNRLGVASGSVNITITNTGASAKQILITYDAAAAGTTTAPSSSAATTPAMTPTETAPSSGTSPSLPASQDVNTKPTATAWCPWNGPRDGRDEMNAGGGKLTASGAPDIQLNEKPAGNQYGYTGKAALNPYFTTPSNPLRQGYVLGFANWFRDTQILGGKSGPVPANRLYYTTEEGAQEALRLVRQYEPEAQLTQYQWGGAAFTASNSMYYVTLPGERMMNAGLVLAGYYNHGEGVTISSDDDLARSVRSA